MGIIPGAGGTQRAARLLGVSKAKNLIFTGRTLNATEAQSWGVFCPSFQLISIGMDLIVIAHIGLVDYVSDPGTTALDRAVLLASEMTSSGELRIYLIADLSLNIIPLLVAPLALKAAKNAISRAPELALESGTAYYFLCQ